MPRLLVLLVSWLHARESIAISAGKSIAVYDASGNSSNETVHTQHFTLAQWDFERVQTPLSVLIWLFFVGLARIGFHQSARLPTMFPESCLLIILGFVAGLVANVAGSSAVSLNPDTFFLFLLPPIVLEAGFFMNIRTLFDNLGTVAWYAVVGTIFNSVTIGVSLYACSASVLGWMTIPMTVLEAMLFASLIAAVDPVAVLAVFQEIHVNEELYIIVFGESLFNDAVSVVLFNMFYKLSLLSQHGEIWVSDWIQACASLFVVGVVGAIIGIVYALITAFITKFTAPVRVLEPLFAFLMAYLAYLTAELFHFSGILAAVFCGMFMKPYIEANMSAKSYTTVKYFLKMLSSVCESIVFMLMGRATADNQSHIDVAFIGLTLIFCLLYRALGVVVLTWIINRFRTIKLGKVDQFVMAYGGLRGAIAMSLALLITQETTRINGYFVTCTIAIVYFTVFVQGITMRPLVNWLKVKKQTHTDLSMNAQLHLRVMDYAMAGLEDLAGIRGHNLLRARIERINMKYVEPLLMRGGPQTREIGIMHVISKLNMKEAINFVAEHGSMQTYHKKASEQVAPAGDEGGSNNPREVLNKWQQAIMLARHVASQTPQPGAAACSVPIADTDTHKILKKNLFKKPKYYRVPNLTHRLRLNESFLSTNQLATIHDDDVLRAVAAGNLTGPGAEPGTSKRGVRFDNEPSGSKLLLPEQKRRSSLQTEPEPPAADGEASTSTSRNGNGNMDDAGETLKGSVVSLPTSASLSQLAIRNPEPVSSSRYSSVISIRVSPPPQNSEAE